MYITIALCIFLTLALYMLVNARKILATSQLQQAEIDRTYQPASQAERQLNNIKCKYRGLQASYKEKLDDLRKGEKRLVQFHLGVGSTDTVAYSRYAEENDISSIEQRLQNVKAELKSLVSEKRACVCRMGSDVTVNGKKSEAKKLFNREIKLRLRCLDNEFKAAAALADWNNINRLIQRTKDTFDEINDSGSIVKTNIQNQYLHLKTQELKLTYELSLSKRELKEAEREEANILREAEREEKRIKAAAEKAENERKLMEKLVAEELTKLETSSEEQKALYKLHKQQLKELKEKEKRAVSLAQTTRAGYVYVISNQLSFGEGIVKIGMTRRADPNERVKELGDASVPELFDVHAFAFTEDAPTLEKYLHNRFAKQRVNLVNYRKEFFTVSPSEVLEKLNECDAPVEIEQFDVEVKKFEGEIKSPHESLIQSESVHTNNSYAEEEPKNSTSKTSNKAKNKGKNDDVRKQEKLKEKLQKKHENKQSSKTVPNPIFQQSKQNKKAKPQRNSTVGTDKLRQFAMKEHPDDYSMQQYVYEEQVEAKAFMDEEATQQEIKAFAMKERPDDYSMQQYVYEEQVEAKAFMDEEATQQEIKAFAMKERPDDYSMQQYVYEEQVGAKAFMDEEATQQETKAFAMKEHPDDYSMQQYVYEEQVEAKAFMDEEATQQEIKAFAMKEHPDDYSMQQYVYEEQIEAS